MMKRKSDDEKKKTISITIDRELFNFLDDTTSNRSRYINWLIIEKLNDIGVDTSKIKL